MATHNKLKQEEIDIIKSLKYNARELSIKLNRNKETITKWARKLGIKLPKIPAYRKYEFNQSSFQEWNEEMAYWLGFLCADGYINRKGRGGVISIRLKLSDKPHLEKFKKFLKTDAPIFEYNVFNQQTQKNYPCCGISICSDKVYYDLCKLIECENKTFRLKVPNNIPENCINHFIRGYFDGDGHISIIKQKLSNNDNLLIQITGQHLFLQNIKNLLNSATNNLFGYIQKSSIGNFSNLSFRGIKSSLPIAIFIYKDSQINTRLDRKYDVFIEYFKANENKLNEKRSIHPKENVFRNIKTPFLKVKEIKKLLSESNLSKKEISKITGVNYDIIISIHLKKSWKESNEFYENLVKIGKIH